MEYSLTILFLSWVWFETCRLIEKGSWKKENFKPIYWRTERTRKYNLTSTKISNGLMTLSLLYIIAEYFQLIALTFLGDFQRIALTIFYWFLWMWIRNIFLHIIFPKWTKGNPNLRLQYLLPFGGLIKR